MKEVKRGEIYYANLCPVIGSEQGGIRPILILQNDIGNQFSPTTIVAAITGKEEKKGIPTHIHVSCKGLKQQSIVLLEQLRTIDKSRLCEYIGKLDEENMKRVEQAILVSLGIELFERL